MKSEYKEASGVTCLQKQIDNDKSEETKIPKRRRNKWKEKYFRLSTERQHGRVVSEKRCNEDYNRNNILEYSYTTWITCT